MAATLCDTLSMSVSILPTKFTANFRDGCREANDTSPRDDGMIIVFGRRLIAEPIFLLTGVLGVVETVVRAMIALIANGIQCFLPQGDFKDKVRNFADECKAFALINLMLTLMLFSWAIKNIYVTTLDSDKDMDAYRDCVKPLSDCLGVQL